MSARPKKATDVKHECPHQCGYVDWQPPNVIETRHRCKKKKKDVWC